MEKSDNAKVPLETALNKTGFGIYSYSYVLFTGVLIISYAFIAYGATILLPTSACELGTTSSQQGLIAAAPVVANMLGASPWGYLGDTRGRRKTLIVSLLATAGVNLVGSLSVNWIMLLIMIFLATFIASGQYSLSMTLLSENLPIAKRSIMLLMVSSIFLLSQGVMAVIAIPIIPLKFSYEIPFLGIYWNSWRLLMLIYSLPSILTAGWLYFMTASPKFALSKGNEEGALEILRTIHRRNGVKEDFQVKSLLSETQKDGGEKPSMKDQIVPLFKAPLLKNTIIVTTLFLFQQVTSIQVWFPTIANQFMKMIDEGAELNQTLCSVIRLGLDTPPDPDAEPCSLNNTAMLIVFATASLQSVVNGIVSLGVNSFGRRNIVIVVCAVCGVSGVLVNLVPNTIASAALFVTFLLGIMVIGLYTAIAVAIFPTHLRALAVGLTMSGARIGSIISVQVLNFLLVTNCDAGFYIFASLFASSAIVASFLPDDRKLMKQSQLASKSAREENTKL